MAKEFISLGMFIIDNVEYVDQPDKEGITNQIGGGGTYAAIGARMFLDSRDIGMLVDKGEDFPSGLEEKLLSFGEDMWYFRTREGPTTRAVNKYVGQNKRFEYLTSTIQVYPNDLNGKQSFEQPKRLHFVCSPKRALEIISEINSVQNWDPLTIYEPIPYSCVPEELPALTQILPYIAIFSPNAEEAFSLLNFTESITKTTVETACYRFLNLVSSSASPKRYIIIRCGPMGSCMASSENPDCQWVEALWQSKDEDKVVDATGAGNAFLGGLAAGLTLTNNNVHEAMFYASVSASFVIQQFGLPSYDPKTNTWNGDSPRRRVDSYLKQWQS